MTLSATLGEVRELAGKKREEREKSLKEALEDRRKRAEDSSWKARAGVTVGVLTAVPVVSKLEGEAERRFKVEEDDLQKRDLQSLQKGLDALDHVWKGRQPTLSALRLEGRSVAESVRASGFEIHRSVSTVGWMDYTWPEVPLNASVPPTIDPAALEVQNRRARQDYEKFQKLLDGPDRLEAFHRAHAEVTELAKGLKGHAERSGKVALENEELKKRVTRLRERQRLLDEELAERGIRPVRSMESGLKADNFLAFNPGGSGLESIVGSLDSLKRVGHEKPVRALALAADGAWAASGDEGGWVGVWNASSGDLWCWIEAHKGIVRGLALSAGGTRLLSCGEDGSVKLWNLSTSRAREVRSWTDLGERVHCVALSPDGKTVAAACSDNVVRIWKLSDAETVALEGHDSPVMCVSFSPDGKSLLSGGLKDGLRLWDVATRKQRRLPFLGHEHAVYQVVFTPDGRHALSAGHDRTIRMWDLQRGTQVRWFEGHTGAVLGLALSEDGRQMVSGDSSGWLAFWRVPALGRLSEDD